MLIGRHASIGDILPVSGYEPPSWPALSLSFLAARSPINYLVVKNIEEEHSGSAHP